MPKLWVVVITILAILVIAGAATLAFWDIPAPSEKIEKVLPDDRFPS